MSLITVDVVLDLPANLRTRVLQLSAALVERMRDAGHPSTFQLGLPFPGGAPADGAEAWPCEPHVSLFMLAVSEPELAELVATVGSVAAAAAPVAASGHEYRHNPQGAPELYFRRSAEWRELQSAVVTATEPLRRSRLREVDPAGEQIADLVERLRRAEPNGAQLRQLLTYGYDEISDDLDDRFHPHVTLAWPADAVPVTFAGLPPADELTGLLTHLGVYAMSGSGTCTRQYGQFGLTGGGLAGPSNPDPDRFPIAGLEKRGRIDV